MNKQMKNWKLNEVILQQMMVFCGLLILVLSILFLTGVIDHRWILNTIFGIGILMNLMISLNAFLKKKRVQIGISLLLAIVMAGNLIYQLVA